MPPPGARAAGQRRPDQEPQRVPTSGPGEQEDNGAAGDAEGRGEQVLEAGSETDKCLTYGTRQSTRRLRGTVL